MREMKIALGQMKAEQGEPSINLAKMEEMIRRAANEGADLICFPELSYTGYFVKKERLLQIAEPQDGYFVRRIRQLAKECGIWVIAGYAQKEGESMYNSCILADRMGGLAGTVRKVYLWKSEKKRFTRGDSFPVFDTELGKLAILICYDLEFPEPARIAALKGAEVIFCPAAWSVPAGNRWELDLKAASLYNLLYTAGVNYSDELCCGCSGASGPDGRLIARAEGQEETIVYAQLTPGRIELVRSEIPYFEDLDGSVLNMLSEAGAGGK